MDEIVPSTFERRLTCLELSTSKKHARPGPNTALPWAIAITGGGRSSVKRYSKVYPRASQLTMSEYLGAAYGLQERIEDLTADNGLQDERDTLVAEIEELAEEQRSKFENMPDGLQQGDTGQLLEERAEAMTTWASDLESIDISEPDMPALTEELGDDAKSDEIEELVEEKSKNIGRASLTNCKTTNRTSHSVVS